MGDGGPFECPDCGRSFSYGTSSCPGCGVDLEWDDEEEATTDEVGDEGLRLVDPRLLPVEGRQAMPGEERIFSRWGLVFALLTVLAFVGTVLLLNWDVWIRGEETPSIGDQQRTLIYVGAVTTTVFAVLTIIDLLMGSPKARGTSGD